LRISRHGDRSLRGIVSIDFAIVTTDFTVKTTSFAGS
jgi:hypothetical protein